MGLPSLSAEVARILDPSLALGKTRDEKKEPPKRTISSGEMEAVKLPSQSDSALGPATPISQRRPTLPPVAPGPAVPDVPAAPAAPAAPKQNKPVDPRGITLPALEQTKPPKA
jgi:hypothetical protein